MSTISAITMTRDRPEAFRLCEMWMSYQTEKPDEWIVVDDGDKPAKCQMGQRRIRLPAGKSGVESICDNLRAGLEAAQGDFIVVMEDDDFYRPWHIDDIMTRLTMSDLVGSIWQPYYNLRVRAWRVYKNRGASLCQTGFMASVIPMVLEAIEAARQENSYGIDGRLWDLAKAEGVEREVWGEEEAKHLGARGLYPSIGIKGMPGKAGLGIGHRPPADWTPDPDCEKLKEWLGDEFAVYEPFLGPVEEARQCMR